jgi:hypothetical protein
MPWPLYPQGKSPRYSHWIGGWVGPTACLDTLKKRKISYSCKELNPGHPAHNPSLSRLSYPLLWCYFVNGCWQRSSCHKNVTSPCAVIDNLWFSKHCCFHLVFEALLFSKCLLHTLSLRSQRRCKLQGVNSGYHREAEAKEGINYREQALDLTGRRLVLCPIFCYLYDIKSTNIFNLQKKGKVGSSGF